MCPTKAFFRVTSAIKPAILFCRLASTARPTNFHKISSFASTLDKIEKARQSKRLTQIATELRKATIVTDDHIPPYVVPSLREMMVDEHGMLINEESWNQTVTTMAVYAACGIPIEPYDIQTFNRWKFEPHLIALFMKKRNAEKKLLNLIRRVDKNATD